MTTSQFPLPGLDDTRFTREKRSQRATRKAKDALAEARIPAEACAHCRHWSRVGKTLWGECMAIKVQTSHHDGVEKGTLLERAPGDRTIYGEYHEPFRTHQTFRACSVYVARPGMESDALQ